MATKHGKAVTLAREGLQPINSHNPLNMYSCEAMLQIKNIFLLSKCLWPHDLSGWQNTGTTPQCGGHVRSRDKLNLLYLHLQKTYENQTRQGTDLQWELPSLKPYDPLITWPTWGHTTISKIYIFFITRLMASKPGRLLTYGRRFITQTLKSSPPSYFRLLQCVAPTHNALSELLFDIFTL